MPEFMQLTCRRRLRIRKGMKHKLSCALGANRYIANTLLHETKEDWQDYLDEIESRLIWGEASSRQDAQALCIKPHSPSCRSFCKRITVLRRQEAFLKTDSPAQCQQQTAKRLARSFERFFAGKGGHPRFKRRGKYESIRFPQFVQLDQEHERIYLPKIGWVRYFADGRGFSTEQAAQVHAATLIRERDEYYIAFEIRTAVPAQMPGAQAAQKCVGIDRGVVNPVMTSDGAVYGAEAQERIKCVLKKKSAGRSARSSAGLKAPAPGGKLMTG